MPTLSKQDQLMCYFKCRIFFIRIQWNQLALVCRFVAYNWLIAGLLFWTKRSYNSMFCSVECPTFLSYYAAVLLITCSYLLRKVNLDEKCRSPVHRCLFYARQQYNVSYVETSSQYYLIKCTIQTIRQWSPLFLWKK